MEGLEKLSGQGGASLLGTVARAHGMRAAQWFVRDAVKYAWRTDLVDCPLKPIDRLVCKEVPMPYIRFVVMWAVYI